MRKNQPRILKGIRVTGYAAEGKALARVDGKVIFIENAVPGDLADVRITKSKKEWAEGRAIHIHEYSAERTDPFCEHFGTCGGCKWQMLPYELQLKYKQEEVEQNLRRIGKINLPEIRPILGSGKTRYYRNKLEFTFSSKKYIPESVIRSGETLSSEYQQPALGFHVPGLFDKIVDIHQCFLQEDPSNEIRNETRRFALENQHSFYDIRSHQGWLRNLMVRACTTGDLMVNLVTGTDQPEQRVRLIDHLLRKFPSISSFYYTINTKFNDSIHDLEPVLYAGAADVTEKLGDLFFKIGPKSFFQTNTLQAERLYKITKEFAELSGHETVYDLYCGTGSIGLFVSDRAKKVVGVEVIEEAVRDARINARLNGIDHARFFAGDVVDICTDGFISAEGKPDVVITDPPRAGMHEKLVKKILAMGAKTVVYVSCNPATQARDLSLLDHLYEVTRVQPVDMFPHTHHIENIVQLRFRNV